MRCQYSGCTGTIEDGFCDVCGRSGRRRLAHYRRHRHRLQHRLTPERTVQLQRPVNVEPKQQLPQPLRQSARNQYASPRRARGWLARPASAACQRSAAVDHGGSARSGAKARLSGLRVSHQGQRPAGIPELEWSGPGDRGAFYANRLERVARGIRQLGQDNWEALDGLSVFVDNMSQIVPRTGEFKGHEVPVRLSRIRILDLLLWTEVAIYGRNPHPVRWTAHQHAFGNPTWPIEPRRSDIDPLPEAGRIKPHVNRPPRFPDLKDVIVFVDDDEGYLRWINGHTPGLVLNCERSPRAVYLKLHRANCGTISGVPARGKSWTGPYLKVCGFEGRAPTMGGASDRRDPTALSDVSSGMTPRSLRS